MRLWFRRVSRVRELRGEERDMGQDVCGHPDFRFLKFASPLVPTIKRAIGLKLYIHIYIYIYIYIYTQMIPTLLLHVAHQVRTGSFMKPSAQSPRSPITSF
jgi:hypothetical protein